MLNQSVPASIAAGFDTLNLISPIRRAVSEEKYTLPTPIQMEAIPHLLQHGGVEFLLSPY